MNTKLLAALVSAAVLPLPALAGVIIGPTSGVINSGGPGSGTLTETFNQSGLTSNYVSGVTDFDSYIASGPTHTNIFSGYEWFSNFGTTSASVTYNLGGIFNIGKLALWNEESSGIGLLDLWYSTDGINFSALSLGLTPTDNPLGPNYAADVFSFASVNAQYVRFDMSRCPQIDPGSYASCAIGEVAFSANVPEPASLALFGIGLAGLASLRRKRS